MKKIDSILRDLSLHDNYNEVSTILQTAKHELLHCDSMNSMND